MQQFFCLCITALLLFACSRKEIDAYYERPEWLAPPIYQQLDKEKRFTTLLLLMDKARYKDILSKAGYWTLFAPNDEAFKNYFAANNIAGVEQIDSATANKIVSYLLVYNAFKTDHISDFQSGSGWVANMAYKRRTAYYNGVYTETLNDQVNKEIASKR